MHQSEMAVKLYAFVYDYSSVKPQKGSLIVAFLTTPMLSDPDDKYAKMSTKKHPFKLLHKLRNGLRRLCEIDMEIAKNSWNRQLHNSLNSTFWLRPWSYRVKMISMARMGDAKVFTARLYAANL